MKALRTVVPLLCAILLGLLPDPVQAAAPGDIITVAGGGVGDNGPATIASLFSPVGVTVDRDGNLYIADYSNNRIRKVTAVSGIITTVAGNGTSGFAGDGDAATTAIFRDPSGVATDSAGNVYIADANNNRIRKVAAVSGIITTVAGNGTRAFAGDGGAATSASLAGPSGVSVDSSGNLYIADNGNYRIRKVAAISGIITTVAGNGTNYIYGFTGDGGAATLAVISSPRKVAVDVAGNLYIADSYNNRIRKVTAVSGIITTVAGNDTNGFAGDGGAATSASLSGPNGVAVDVAGNLYIADSYNNRIRKVAAVSGIITTVAGNDTNGFAGDGGAATSASLSGPNGVAVDSAGNLYIADTSYNHIRKVAADSGIITTVAGNGATIFGGDAGAATLAGLRSPVGVTVDSAGNLYIADSANHNIRKLTIISGIITTVAGNGTSGFAGDGDAATSANLAYPVGVTVDSAGNLYIIDSNNKRIRKVDAVSGIITTVAGNGISGYAGDGGTATSASFFGPMGVTVDSSGNLYIADSNNNRIRMVAADSGIISTVAGNGTSGYAGDGGAATSANLAYPVGVTVDSTGNLYITDQSNKRIRKVDAITGIITTVAGNGIAAFAGDGGAATSASLKIPWGVTVDRAGNLYIADSGNHRVRNVDTVSGIITTAAGNGTSGFAGDGGAATSATLIGPRGVIVDSTGNLYIADQYNNRIRKVIKPGATSATIGYSPSGPFKAGDLVTITATFNDLVVDTPAPQIALSGANTLTATDMTKVDSTRYTYAYTVVAGTGTVTVSLPTGIDVNGVPLSATPGSGATFNVAVPTITVPGPPTAVSVSAGNAQATVSFTAPANNGGSAITSFTATSNPGNFTATGNASPMTVTGLTNGTAYTFTVAATNAAGTGAASAPSASVTPVAPDAIPPTLILSSLANGAVTNNATLNISGNVTDPSGVATLTINNSTVTVSGGNFSHAVSLQAGTNTITAIATDTLGNQTTDTRTITLDQSAPVLAVTAPADNSKTAQAPATITGTVSETSTVTITVNSGTPQNASISGSAYSATVNLASGLNTITITATDLAGNTSSVVRTVTYDNTNPSLAITGPNQDITVNQNILTISGTVSDTITSATVTLSFNNQTYTPTVTNGTFSQLLTIPAEGTYTITATATDEAGNSSSVTRNIIYVIPVNGTCGSSNGQTQGTAPSINLCTTGTASAITGIGPWNWTCSGSNGGTDATCSTDIQSYTITFTSGGNGTLTGTASQTINYGGSVTKVTAVPATGYHFVNWTEGPTVVGTTAGLTISNVTAAHTYTANFAADTPAPVNGACGSSNGVTFTVAPTINFCTTGTASAVIGSGPWSWNCNGTNGGTNATCDAAIDVTGPMLALSTLANGAITNNVTLNVSGTVSDASSVSGLTINNAVVTVIDGSFSHAVSLQAGANTITTIATDTLGNSTTDTRIITLDQAAPILTITAPADNSKTAQPLATITGTISETSTVTITDNSGTPQDASITGSAYSATVNLSSGLNSITITATDLAGNTSSTVRTVTYDNTNPSLAITDPNQDITTAQNSLTISGTVSDTITSATVTVTFDNQTYTPAVANDTFSQQLTIPAEGTYAITATATDEAGNSSGVTRNVIYAPPVLLYTGDLTGNGKVDISDALMALRMAVGLVPIDSAALAAGDVAPFANGKPAPDEKIDISDALAILRKCVGLVSW